MADIDGLLLLWYAAVELEGSEIVQMILQARNRRNHSLKLLKSQDLSSHNGKKSQIPVRHSHNELEKCRRAHLRSCMDKLKRVLRFDQESVPCRVTMLNVLKKASSTIYTHERRIHSMNIKETMAKNRFVELTNKLNNLQRQYKRLKNMQVMSMDSSKAERMRNYSECSVLTTSSDDSNFDGVRSHRLSTNYSKLNNEVTSPIQNYKELSNYYNKMSPNQDDSISNIVNNVYKCSSPNSNSCDSGFEESHTNKNIKVTGGGAGGGEGVCNGSGGAINKALQSSFKNFANVANITITNNNNNDKFLVNDPGSTIDIDQSMFIAR